MTKPPDDFDIPDDATPPDDDGEEIPDSDERADGPKAIGGPFGFPPDAKKRKVKVKMSPGAQDVKFADMFGFTISQAHGVIKFGVFHPETGDFIIHTQIAMTPQAMIALEGSLRKNLEKVRKRKPGQGGPPGGNLN